MLYLIVTGGPLPNEASSVINGAAERKDGAVVIGCDGGCDFLALRGIIPDIAVGDMDSISDNGMDFLKANNVFIERYPVEKDWTDTEIALGKTEADDDVIILAPVTGRIDHIIANIQLALKLRSSGRNILITDGITYCYPLCGEDSVTVDTGSFTEPVAVSLVPWNFDVPVKGVTTKGLYYSLNDHDLMAGSTFSFSNCPVKDAKEFTVSVRSGMLLVTVTKAL